ncbi:MAG: TfoX/Sxy family protein [Gammaproteobacteria bacterium]|nr:TfoX/Sxy family protein [Gammaproteobacteria bacterium]
MVTHQNRKLTDLKNIGQKLASRLKTININSEKDLQKIGAVEAHKLLKIKYPNETLPVCYYLYSFEGALCDKHWNDIGDKKKRELKEGIG